MRAAGLAIDIGSTVVKIAQLDDEGRLLRQDHFPRDFEKGIAKQVEALLDDAGWSNDGRDLHICSSANGGLRVGIVCLTKHYSGAVLRNQVLLAGANPIFMHHLDEDGGHVAAVDVLLVGGGIDCDDARPLASRLRRFKHDKYSYGVLAYAGNAHLAQDFVRAHPGATVISNPLADGLSTRDGSVFEALRRVYLDDLVYKEGVSELRDNLSRGIRPTPEVVNRGFLRALQNRSSLRIAGACVVMDIGGATTDLHYTVEIVAEGSTEKPFEGSSVARYVFVDLGIVASRDSTLSQLRTHARLYEFLSAILQEDIRDVYRLIREGEYAPEPKLLAYACVFLSLDRFAHGRGPGLPSADLNRVAQVILSGGAAQTLEESAVERLLKLFVTSNKPEVMIDRKYQLWVDGITWADAAPQ